jgi:hypothetical protein
LESGGQGRRAREAAFWAEEARRVGLPEIQRPGDGSPFGAMLAEIGGVAGARVLDVCCGSGAATVGLALAAIPFT